jgi:hypothetical protein
MLGCRCPKKENTLKSIKIGESFNISVSVEYAKIQVGIGLLNFKISALSVRAGVPLVIPRPVKRVDVILVKWGGG